MNYLFGYPVSLVLRDERGEFEVRDAFTATLLDDPKLDLERVLDAINSRTAGMPLPKRPIY